MSQQKAKKAALKKEETEKEIAAAKENFDLVARESQIIIQDTTKETEIFLLQALCDYWDAYHDYCSKSLKWITNIRPTVQKCREHVIKAQDELEQQKANRNNAAPVSAADSRVFGVSLDEICAREITSVPKFFEKCTDWLMKKGPTMEGVFRISAKKSDMVHFQERIDSGEDLDLNDIEDPNVVPCLLKQYLRDLPEPLIPFDMYKDFLLLNSIEDQSKMLEEMKNFVSRLPKFHRLTFKRLIQCLSLLVEHEETTKMGASNLAVVINPNVVYARELNPLTMVEEMENSNSMLVAFITHAKEIFKVSSVFQAVKENDLQALKELQAQGQSLVTPDADGITCAHLVVMKNFLSIAKYLAKQNVDWNAQDSSGKTPLMFINQDDDRTKKMIALLKGSGADLNASVNGKSVLDFLEVISPDLKTFALEAPSSLKKSKSRSKKRTKTVGEGGTEIGKLSRAPSSGDVGTLRERKSRKKPPSKPLPKPKPESDSSEPSKLESPPRSTPLAVVATPEETSEVKIESASPSKNVLFEKLLSSESNTVDSENELETVIFNRVATLQSLVSTEIPLQSVFSILNISEMTDAAIQLVKCSFVNSFGAAELVTLNTSLKVAVDSLKNLFNVVKKFASLFGDEEKKEILSNALLMQNTTRSLIAVVKDLNVNPGSSASRDELLSSSKQLVDTVYKFYKACETAGLEYLNTTMDSCQEHSKTLSTVLAGDSQQALDDTCSELAFSVLKLGQLVKVKILLTQDEDWKASVNGSMSIIERTALEMINEGKKLWAQGTKQACEDLTSLCKKLSLEFKQLKPKLAAENFSSDISDAEQQTRFVQLYELSQALEAKLQQVNWNSDLDKALVLQASLITKSLHELSNFASMEKNQIIGCSQSLADCYKKIRVGITSIEKKSRDNSLNRKLKVWAETMLNSVLLTRLAVTAHVLQLPIVEEIPLVSCFFTAFESYRDFYDLLVELRNVSS